MAQDLVFYHDNNTNGKFDDVSAAKRADVVNRKKNGATPAEVDAAAKELTTLDNVIYRFKMGRTISIGLSYKF